MVDFFLPHLCELIPQTARAAAVCGGVHGGFRRQHVLSLAQYGQRTHARGFSRHMDSITFEFGHLHFDAARAAAGGSATDTWHRATGTVHFRRVDLLRRNQHLEPKNRLFY